MNALLLTLLAGLSAAGVSGQVLTPTGEPAAGARVFVEPGLAGALRDQQAGGDGRFRFDNVEPGAAGIFAYLEGFGFYGAHQNLARGEHATGVVIRLREAERLEGRVLDHRGEPIEGARIMRVALLGDAKVGLPLAKLRAHGFEEPQSGEDGRFVVDKLPRGELLALKIGHPRYAQEGVVDVPAGTRDLRVTMHAGVLLQGEVHTRVGQRPVANAAVIIRNAQPPHDTALARTDGAGAFNMRLKPGVYLYQAIGPGYQSPGWQRLDITGETPSLRARLPVAGTGVVRGEIRDAVSGEPIEGVRMSLLSEGNIAEVARTGPTGAFRFVTSAGETVVRFEAAPGYAPPPSNAVRVHVEEGADIELPGMWLAPLPDFRVQIVDEDGVPVPGAMVSVLRPQQIGWRAAGEEGWVTLRVSVLPEDGRVIGMAEDPRGPRGAVFALTRAESEGARVQLLPYGAVRGKVVGERNRALPGAVVGAVYPGGDEDEELLLWRTVSGRDGAFQWDAVVPGLPLRCVARAGEAAGASAAFNLAPEQTRDVGAIVVGAGERGEAQAGRALRWWDLPVACAPGRGMPERGAPLLLVYAAPGESAVLRETLSALKRHIQPGTVRFAVAAAPGQPCDETSITLLEGRPPGPANAYLIDASGTVRLESIGVPPLHLIRALAEDAG